MTLEELKERYKNIPQELKNLKRWVGYSIVSDENTGENKKMPANPLNGRFAQSNNPLTWSSFNVALTGMIKYNFVGIGFVLGQVSEDVTYFGVDIDNHADKVTGEKISQDKFDEIANEFINELDSYTEYSHSGEGIHIICKGKLPEGSRRKANCNVEMYDSGRFFTMTGNVINLADIKNCEEEIKPLWKKYLGNEETTKYTAPTQPTQIVTTREGKKRVFSESEEDEVVAYYSDIALSDEEILDKIAHSKQASDFFSLYEGDMTKYGNDHSIADSALCTMLAFWTGNNANQIDSIFRKSALMRDKWDSKRRNGTYGQETIARVISINKAVYEPKKEIVPLQQNIQNIQNIQENDDDEVVVLENIDKDGNVILKFTPQFIKQYEVSDTGNAERMYDYFGDLFKYNKDNKSYMFWNGRIWLKDTKDGDLYIRKYADETKNILLDEIENDRKRIKEMSRTIDDEDKRNDYLKTELKKLQVKEANAVKISNKSGKDAMINELKHLHCMTIANSEFDKDIFLLNTKSGIVDLKKAELMPFSKEYMQSKSTNSEVSFEDPVTWIKFLHEILERPTPEETQELVDCVQKALGYSLSGSTKEQCMFLLYGATGSNGKSTFVEQIQKILGDYAITTPVSTLMSRKSSNRNTEQLYALSKLHNSRFVICGETEEDERMSESIVKIMTGSDTIQARHPYGEEFDFKPSFKIWMMTNHKPIIRGQEYAIWRRLFFIPFEKTFDETNKDVDLPEKLDKERNQILGWCIKGFLKYQEEGLSKPKCVEVALKEYKEEMNVINSYLKEQTIPFTNFQTKASALYQDYFNWAKRNNEKILSQTRFGNEMKKVGIPKKAKSDGTYYIGIKLNSDNRGRSFTNEENDDEE